MAMTNTAVFPQTPKTAYAVTTAANTTWTDAPNNAVSLLTAGANGAEVTSLTVTPRATCTATAAHLYLSKDSGTTKRLIRSALLPADTVSTTDPPATTDFGFGNAAPLRLAAGDVLYVGAAVALTDGFSWVAQYREF